LKIKCRIAPKGWGIPKKKNGPSAQRTLHDVKKINRFFILFFPPQYPPVSICKVSIEYASTRWVSWEKLNKQHETFWKMKCSQVRAFFVFQNTHKIFAHCKHSCNNMKSPTKWIHYKSVQVEFSIVEGAK